MNATVQRIVIAVRNFEMKNGWKRVQRIELGYEEYKDLRMDASIHLQITCSYDEEQKQDVVVTEFCGIPVFEKPIANWLSVE